MYIVHYEDASVRQQATVEQAREQQFRYDAEVEAFTLKTAYSRFAP